MEPDPEIDRLAVQLLINGVLLATPHEQIVRFAANEILVILRAANRGMDFRKGSNLEPIGPELFQGVDGLIVPKRLGVGAGGRKEVSFDLIYVDVLPRTVRRCRRHEARQARTRDPDCQVSRQSNRRGSNKPFGASSR